MSGVDGVIASMWQLSFYHPYAIRFENKPVLVCRGLKADMQEIWAQVKDWD